MDPHKAECIGFYLYGAGYFSRDDNTLALVTGRPAEHFCLSCPVVLACERRQKERLREQQPALVEAYERAVAQAERGGISRNLVAYALARQGRSPYFADAMDSFARGHADRGKVAGTLLAPKGGGDVR